MPHSLSGFKDFFFLRGVLDQIQGFVLGGQGFCYSAIPLGWTLPSIADALFSKQAVCSILLFHDSFF